FHSSTLFSISSIIFRDVISTSVFFCGRVTKVVMIISRFDVEGIEYGADNSHVRPTKHLSGSRQGFLGGDSRPHDQNHAVAVRSKYRRVRDRQNRRRIDEDG